MCLASRNLMIASSRAGFLLLHVALYLSASGKGSGTAKTMRKRLGKILKSSITAHMIAADLILSECWSAI